MELLRSITLKNLDTTKQPLVGIPMELVRNAPSGCMSEWTELRFGAIAMSLVSPKEKSKSVFKRFNVIEHRGTHFTSIPKPWLRFISAVDGDMIDVFVNDERDGLVLVLRKQGAA